MGDLEPFAEVKTFHSYCKKILHEQKGRVELRSYLTEIIQDDALLLNTQFYNFDTKFQTLEEGKEIDFYLRRGDYYEAVGFNDSVFRLYKIFQVNHDIIPSFDNILIDEFQDFNRLEVAFIKELEEKGTIIIVGDDDQAVYDGRSSSPDFLRDLYESKRFVIFPLPFCSRSTQVIVDVTNMLVKKAISSGYFKGHIPKEYECYLPDKEVDSLKYPKIVTSQLKTIKSIPKYIKKEILNISPEDIAESYVEGKEYPTVLIIGQRHYLAEIEKQLKKDFTQVYYSPSEEQCVSICDGYKELIDNKDSNLGWRILTKFLYDQDEQKDIVASTELNANMVDILDPDFVKIHLKAVELLKSAKDGEGLDPSKEKELREILGETFEAVIQHFIPKDIEEELVLDRTIPKIVLRSFIGSKGLSGGHVFIVGMNDGSLPRDRGDIKDVEISQFIVALTRTRKQCHILTNKWLYAPKSEDGAWVQAFEKSIFLSWIPPDFIEDKGLLSSEDL